jgi:hypothetical protein
VVRVDRFGRRYGRDPWAPPRPTVAEVDEGHEYENATHVYRPGGPGEPDRVLVAAIELVSPGNKDRPAARAAFASNCVDLVRQNVCVSLIDLVTTMSFNLYAHVLGLMRKSDPTFSPIPPATYAATIRRAPVGVRYRLESWGFPMAIGERLSSLPISLTETTGFTLDLESSCEDVCRILRLP